MAVTRWVRIVAIVGAFIGGALVTFAVLPHTLMVVTRARSLPLPPGPATFTPPPTIQSVIDPPWVPMFLVGLTVAIAVHWLTGRIADHR